jgi:hypothetical protein
MPSNSSNSFLPCLRSVFYSRFDESRSPEIAYQVPKGLIASSTGGLISTSIVARPQGTRPRPALSLYPSLGIICTPCERYSFLLLFLLDDPDRGHCLLGGLCSPSSPVSSSSPSTLLSPDSCQFLKRALSCLRDSPKSNAGPREGTCCDGRTRREAYFLDTDNDQMFSTLLKTSADTQSCS